MNSGAEFRGACASDQTRRWRSPVAGALALAATTVLLAGCGSSSSSSSSSSSPSSSSSSSTSASTTASSPAAAAHPRPIPGVGSVSGGVPLTRASLHKLRRVAKGGGVAAHLGGLGKLPLTQAIAVVSSDVNHFWSTEFANSGIQWPAMQQVLVTSGPVSTGCSVRATIAPTDSWFLCDGQNGGTFYWTLPWIQQNIATDPGGVNLGFGVAEMWSYHILNLSGATAQLSSGALSKGQWAQQVVCLTGIYVRSLNQRKLFERGDQQAFDSFLGALSSVSGITAPDVTRQQLTSAFLAGFNSGTVSTCGLGSGGGSGGGGTGTQTQSATPSGTGSSPAPISPLPATTTS